VRRETVGEYLRAAGITVRGRGRQREGPAKAAIAGREMCTDLPSKPAITPGVSTDSVPARVQPGQAAVLICDRASNTRHGSG